ncbi:MAG: bifunctional UDP-N-acetylglucosamine diphosphorylase/glucosamine-1-phosphate N-acetyltransferase GlmU [Peptoclostridium sp.]|uniref:bifunctional UDP-N-acetylglucosamine diphosphorylase/glucosamine-1-phosphate N-acetyltransferase GlmU n=1 Tax=Peptoclostridium sp. TaxID=1904860 RepID=UPI00139C7CCB|nr:bifunctional UDP-N-acetylglucosamine diphosphorylase/glucosamine-1-phosphate N-acetyltransferase GlmU [Peptoclostridium sp.]MZQ74976.1 bifunctional UDP-N-acetylglucosamine diphosphorylase/glucosamine-1-phosphate N-acetyltransferase GlmU [Peptoclostridium sp.]
MGIKAIILAAGKGTRMKSKLPKVLHKVCGKEMVNHVIDASLEAGAQSNIVVIGHGAEAVGNCLPEGVKTVVQEEQLGTGHAVMMANNYIDDSDTIVILCGDTPLIEGETIKALIEFHRKYGFAVSVLSALMEKPKGYGRIIRGESKELVGIVEEKDASEEQRLICEINSGMYCFEGKALREALLEIRSDNSQGEYYLTDAVEIIRGKGLTAGAYAGATSEQIMGVNNRLQLSEAECLMKKRINEFHMLNGVTLIDPVATYIESGAVIGSDTVIYPGSIIKGYSVIGEGCIVGPGCTIDSSRLDDGCEIQNSVIVKSSVGSGSKVGPFAYLRPNSTIGRNVKIGDFVEVKNSTVGDNSKASHLSYIGDADVGEDVNIGCGTVFVNYDGKKKSRAKVGDRSFIGCNTNLIAPVELGENSYIAAGSTITDDVPEDSFAIARQRQTTKEGYLKSGNWGKKD